MVCLPLRNLKIVFGVKALSLGPWSGLRPRAFQGYSGGFHCYYISMSSFSSNCGLLVHNLFDGLTLHYYWVTYIKLQPKDEKVNLESLLQPTHLSATQRWILSLSISFRTALSRFTTEGFRAKIAMVADLISCSFTRLSNGKPILRGVSQSQEAREHFGQHSQFLPSKRQYLKLIHACSSDPKAPIYVKQEACHLFCI